MLLDIDHETIIAAKSGDSDAINKIFNVYKYLIKMKSKQFFIIGADKEDVYQEAMIGLLKAIRSYESNKDSSFRTFASLCMQRQIITAVKTAHTKKHNLLKNDPIEDEAKMEEEGAVSPEDLFMSKELSESLNSFMLDNLSKLEIKVYKLLIKGYDYQEISKKLKMPTKSADNAIQRIRKKGDAWLKDFDFS